MGDWVSKVDSSSWPWWVTANSANDIVLEKFQLTQTISADALAKLNDAITALKNALATFTMDDPDISYAYIPDNIQNILSLLQDYVPTPPNKEDLVIPDVDIPTDLELPAFTGVKPTADISPPDYSFSYSQNPYVSEILELLKSKLKTDLGVLGTGIGVDGDFKDASYAWQRKQLLTEYQKAYQQVLNENSGFSLPPGATTSRLDQLTEDYNSKLDDLANKIIESEIKLAIEHKRWVVEKCIALEQMLMSDFSQYQGRSLEAAKATLDAAIRIHESLLKAYEMELDVFKTENEVYQTQVKTQVDVFNAKINRSRAILDAAVERVKAIVSVFTAEADSFKAISQAVSSQVGAEVELVKARVSQSEIQANIAIKKAEVKLQGQVQQYQLTFECIRALTNVLAQLVASSLGAVSASASVGNSFGESRGISKGYSESIGNSLGESHGYDETAI